jgi:hypothetical protein
MARSVRRNGTEWRWKLAGEANRRKKEEKW